jgi:hypothetical protein
MQSRHLVGLLAHGATVRIFHQHVPDKRDALGARREQPRPLDCVVDADVLEPHRPDGLSTWRPAIASVWPHTDGAHAQRRPSRSRKIREVHQPWVADADLGDGDVDEGVVDRVRCDGGDREAEVLDVPDDRVRDRDRAARVGASGRRDAIGRDGVARPVPVRPWARRVLAPLWSALVPPANCAHCPARVRVGEGVCSGVAVDDAVLEADVDLSAGAKLHPVAEAVGDVDVLDQDVHQRVFGVVRLEVDARLRLYPIVASQYSSTTLYQVPYHIR